MKELADGERGHSKLAEDPRVLRIIHVDDANSRANGER